jgi:hypothetical protein
MSTNTTRKISFRPNTYPENKNTRASTSTRWRMNDQPPIHINHNIWDSKVAHIGATIFQKNTRNKMLNNYNRNPYINEVLKNYYNGIDKLNYPNNFKKNIKNKLKKHMKLNVTRRINKMGAKNLNNYLNQYFNIV